MLVPERIAIVGASDTPGPTADLIQTLEAFGYPGEILPVNPNRPSVAGRRAYATLGAIPGPIDLVIVAVAMERVEDVVRDAATVDVGGLFIYTAGFAEMGDEGRLRQDRLRQLAGQTGMRLLGPNAIGFVNVADRTAAIVMPPRSLPANLAEGPVAIVSQSGGLMISVLEYGARVGLGFRTLVATGNEADIGLLDALETALADDAVRAIGLIAEGIADGRRLAALAAEGARNGKAIVALKLGRSARGAEAARTHTASLAGSGRVFDAVARQVGMAVVDSIPGLVDQLALVGRIARPIGPTGLAVLTISGGTKVLVADRLAAAGVILADLAPATIARLADAIPDIGRGDNPLDITAAAIQNPDVLRAAVRALDDDPAVGLIAFVLHLRRTGGALTHRRLIRAFAELQGEVRTRLIVASSIPEGIGGYWRRLASRGPVPFLNGLEALDGIGVLQGPKPAQPLPLVERAVPDEVTRARAAGRTTLDQAEARAILSLADIPVPEMARVADVDAAVGAAERIGYPIVLKLDAAGVTHKTELDGVRLDLRTGDDVRAAAAEILTAAAGRADGSPGLLVQESVAGVVELLVGVHLDPQFGPVLTVGHGGIHAEAYEDTALRIAPVDAATAEAMLDELRVGRRLRGWRGGPPLALDLVAAAVARISTLGAGLAPAVTALEVNPLLVGRDRIAAVDVVVTLAPPDRWS